MLYTNCRSLNHWKLEELSVYAEIHKPDVICLTETWLDKNKESARQIVNYDNHFCHRKGRLGGGVAILTSNVISCKELCSNTTSTISAIWVKINKEKCAPLIICCIYHPPGASNDSTLEYLSTTTLKLAQKHPTAQFIITGDFNRLPLENYQQQNNLTNLVTFHTRENATLDLILTDIAEYSPATKLAPIADNDHCCLLLNGVPPKTRKYQRVVRRMVNEHSKRALYQAVALESWSGVLEAQTVDGKVEALHKTIEHILDTHCPKRSVKQRQNKPQWITGSVIKTSRAKNKAYNNDHKSWKALNALSQRMLRSSKRKFVSEHLNKDQNTKQWWETLNQLTHKTSNQNNNNRLLIDGEFLTTQDFTNNINDYYLTVGGEAIPQNDLEIRSLHDSHPLDLLSIGEVKRLIRKLDTTKSTSSEDFPTWLSKECCEDICIPIHDIINCMLSTGRYPTLWKRAQVAPQPKIKNPSEYKHYRPISLLFHLGKLAESVIIDKMRSKIELIIKPDQYAYRPKLSTTDALLQYLDDLTALLDRKDVKFVQSACLDFSKAFDRLQPSIVLNKMRSYGFNSNVIELVSSFLSDRLQCVKFSGQFSSYKPINVGSPQGTRLGPLLWLIYVNDLSVDGFNSLKYADDTTFYLECCNTNETNLVGDAILTASRWSDDNNMILNQVKTIVMNTDLSRQNHYCDSILVGDTSISPSTETKLLGVTVDNKLSFNSHVDSLISKTNSRIFLMRQLKTAGLNADGLKTYFITNIRSILLYGSPAWYTLLSQTCKDSLELIQRSATRVILPDLDYDDRLVQLGLPTLNSFIFTHCQNHFSKIRNDSSHPLFSRIVFNDTNLRRSSRCNTLFRPERTRTAKRSNSFFQYFMRFLDNGNMYL